MEVNEPTQPAKSPETSSARIILSFIWVLTLIIAGYFGFLYGKGTSSAGDASAKKVLPAVSSMTSTPIPQSTPSIVDNNVCKKSGFAQKWEYLIPYVIKENDSLQSIVASELKDPSRINEVMELNGVGPLVLGSTLYLPPKSITKSTGNIKQVHGKLIEKNNASWQLSFNGQKDGQGILIPSFWFGEIPNTESYKVDDCLTVLLDDGFKVFTVSKQ